MPASEKDLEWTLFYMKEKGNIVEVFAVIWMKITFLSLEEEIIYVGKPE